MKSLYKPIVKLILVLTLIFSLSLSLVSCSAENLISKNKTVGEDFEKYVLNYQENGVKYVAITPPRFISIFSSTEKTYEYTVSDAEALEQIITTVKDIDTYTEKVLNTEKIKAEIAEKEAAASEGKGGIYSSCLIIYLLTDGKTEGSSPRCVLRICIYENAILLKTNEGIESKEVYFKPDKSMSDVMEELAKIGEQFNSNR